MEKSARLFPGKNIESIKRTRLLHERSLKKTWDSLEDFSQAPSRRRIEKEFLNYISLGNPALAEQYIETLAESGQFNLGMGSLSENALQQARFAIVASITLFCRTAIDCGLPEAFAYSISDVYIQYLSNTKDEEKIYLLFVQAFLEYCQSLQNWRLSDCSPQLKICCEYIMSHLHTKITMEELGKACSLSPNYVSDLFEKELGIRPSVYIRKEKLKYAAYLLENTPLSSANISEILAFPSASAFTVQFREEYGVTPNRYRKKSSNNY